MNIFQSHDLAAPPVPMTRVPSCSAAPLPKAIPPAAAPARYVYDEQQKWSEALVEGEPDATARNRAHAHAAVPAAALVPYTHTAGLPPPETAEEEEEQLRVALAASLATSSGSAWAGGGCEEGGARGQGYAPPPLPATPGIPVYLINSIFIS